MDGTEKDHVRNKGKRPGNGEKGQGYNGKLVKAKCKSLQRDPKGLDQVL